MKPTAETKKSASLFYIFSGLLLLFTLSRLLPIFTAVERVSHYDELDLGVIAKEWIEGPSLPFWHYQMDPYGGESIVLGALAVPFVKLLGPTLLAVKFPSLIFAMITFTLLFMFLLHHFNRKAAISGALLLIFAPPSFVQFSLAGLSGHAEALAFSIASLYFFYQYVFGAKKNISIFLFGILSGLGFWFFNENIVLTLTCILSWLILDRKSFFSRAFPVFLSGLALGLIPWFSYLSYYKEEGLAFASANLSQAAENLGAFNYLARKTAKLLLIHLPNSFAFFPVLKIHEKIYSWIYFCAAYVPTIILAVKQRFSAKLLPLLLFPFVFTLLFILSYFDIASDIGYIGYRYLAPLHFFIMLLSAILLSEKYRRLFIFCLILGVLGQSSLIFKEPFGRAQKYKGYSYYRVGTQWIHTLRPAVKNSKDLEHELSKRNSADAYFLLWGMSSADNKNLFSSLYRGEWLPPLIPSTQAENLAFSHLRDMWDSNTLFNRQVQKSIAELPIEERPLFYQGLGWAVRAVHREDLPRGLDWIETFPADMKSQGLQGFKKFEEHYGSSK